MSNNVSLQPKLHFIKLIRINFRHFVSIIMITDCPIIPVNCKPIKNLEISVFKLEVILFQNDLYVYHLSCAKVIGQHRFHSFKSWRIIVIAEIYFFFNFPHVNFEILDEFVYLLRRLTFYIGINSINTFADTKFHVTACH